MVNTGSGSAMMPGEARLNEGGRGAALGEARKGIADGTGGAGEEGAEAGLEGEVLGGVSGWSGGVSGWGRTGSLSPASGETVGSNGS